MYENAEIRNVKICYPNSKFQIPNAILLLSIAQIIVQELCFPVHGRILFIINFNKIIKVINSLLLCKAGEVHNREYFSLCILIMRHSCNVFNNGQTEKICVYSRLIYTQIFNKWYQFQTCGLFNSIFLRL